MDFKRSLNGQFATLDRVESPVTDLGAPVEMDDPRPSMKKIVDARGAASWSGRIELRHLVTDASAMDETVESGRVSDSPDSPVELCLRDGRAGRFEIVDGHHRVAAAIRDGATDIDVMIFDYTDDEPYQGPFYNF